MKTRLLTIVVTLALVLSLTGIVVAAPRNITGFSIAPNPAFPGETLTFTVSTDGQYGTDHLCFFGNPISGLTYTFPTSGALTSAQGDTWTWATPAAPCATAKGMLDYTSGTNGEFGDSFTFNVTTTGPTASSATDTWQARHYSGLTQLNRLNATVNILVAGTLYVANDSAACGGNTPCLTGQGALNRAIDGVTPGGTVIVLGTYNMSPSVSADLTDAKTVTLTGQGGASLNNAAGACSANAMVEVSNASAILTVTNLTIDGTCTSGNRTAGILNTSGTTNVKTGTSTIRDFTGSGNAGVEVVAGTMTVENNTFSNNQTALEGTGGTLYAFANNVMTNNGTNAATGINDATDNVRCNYWGSAGIDSSAQYLERLGSPIASYVEGTGSLALGQASLASNGGNQVLINLGRSTSNPPFNNGTVAGLGALVSDFFAACGSRGSSTPGAITITGDSVTPGVPGGFRLYSITTPVDCSPSDNTACWNYQSVSCFTAGCSVTDGTVNAGHFVIGNQVDPTAVTLRDLSATPHAETGGLWVGLALVLGLLVIIGWSLRRRAARA